MYLVTVADAEGSEEEDASPLAEGSKEWVSPHRNTAIFTREKHRNNESQVLFGKYFIAMFVKLLQQQIF